VAWRNVNVKFAPYRNACSNRCITPNSVSICRHAAKNLDILQPQPSSWPGIVKCQSEQQYSAVSVLLTPQGCVVQCVVAEFSASAASRTSLGSARRNCDGFASSSYLCRRQTKFRQRSCTVAVKSLHPNMCMTVHCSISLHPQLPCQPITGDYVIKFERNSFRVQLSARGIAICFASALPRRSRRRR